jgi:simple sugar transport system permease protein
MSEITKISPAEQQIPFSQRLKSFLINYSVTILFVILGVLGAWLSGLPVFFLVNELLTRITRNSFLVLSLLIPVLAGMGLNFSITIGAMAGQLAIILVSHWGIGGFTGFMVAVAIAAPFAVIFGILTGRLLNKTRGQEMIASMITGFFANGIYQFVFLFALGSLIPFTDPRMMMSGGVGIRNTVDLSGEHGIKYALDGLAKWPFFYVLMAGCAIGIIYFVQKTYLNKSQHITVADSHKGLFGIVLCLLGIGVGAWIMFSPSLPMQVAMMKNLKLPIVTSLVIIALCIFNVIIVRTKLGQDFRTVGQDQHIAQVAGIHVDKVRIIAITISMVLASWGQIIFLQNMSVLNTYGSHVQIGMFSVAALLIGGASVSRATVGQAILGVILFHTLFIVSPKAGQNLFGDAQIGEFFRAFVAYGVIGVSLGLHAMRKVHEAKKE